MPRIELCKALYWLRGALGGPIELEKEETRMRALGFLLLGCLWLARWLTERH